MKSFLPLAVSNDGGHYVYRQLPSRMKTFLALFTAATLAACSGSDVDSTGSAEGRLTGAGIIADDFHTGTLDTRDVADRRSAGRQHGRASSELELPDAHLSVVGAGGNFPDRRLEATTRRFMCCSLRRTRTFESRGEVRIGADCRAIRARDFSFSKNASSYVRLRRLAAPVDSLKVPS